MTNTNTKRIHPGTFTLALGVLLFLFGVFALVTKGDSIFISLGIFFLGAGFVGYIFQNDVFDITLGMVTALAVLMFSLYMLQSRFLPSSHSTSGEHSKSVEHSGEAAH